MTMPGISQSVLVEQPRHVAREASGALRLLNRGRSRDAEAHLTAGVSAAEAWAQGMLEAFDVMCCGAVLLNSAGRAIRFNRQMAGRLEHGLWLRAGRVVAEEAQSEACLRTLLATALDPASSN